MTRLLSENWSEMTEAARSAPSHVSKLERWEKIAAERNPALDAGQVTRMAEMLRRQHYQELARLSVEARRIAALADDLLKSGKCF